MSKFTKKEREMLLAELDARYDEIVNNETEEQGGGYTKADVNTLDRATEKLRELFEMLYE